MAEKPMEEKDLSRPESGTGLRRGETDPGDPDRIELRLLEAAPLLAGLTGAQRREMLASAQIRTVEAGEVLFHQGDAATSFYFLTDGRIKLTQLSAEGEELLVRFITSGQPLAAISLLRDRTYPVTATAAVKSRLLSWSGSRLERLTREVPGVLRVAGEAMADHMEEVTGRLREVSTERVAQRLARALLRLAEQVGRPVEEGVLLDVPLSRRDLAEMTGTTLYTVSRQLSKWESEGWVVTGRERVVLREPERLAAVVGEVGGGTG